jgi:hypothetical protein
LDQPFALTTTSATYATDFMGSSAVAVVGHGAVVDPAALALAGVVAHLVRREVRRRACGSLGGTVGDGVRCRHTTSLPSRRRHLVGLEVASNIHRGRNRHREHSRPQGFTSSTRPHTFTVARERRWWHQRDDFKIDTRARYCERGNNRVARALTAAAWK